MENSKQNLPILNRRVHMSNERTFLSWTRTSISIIAFGFIVERFATPSTDRSSMIVGIGLVSTGTLLSLLSFLRYKKVQKQINSDMYHSSSLLDLILMLMIFTTGIILVISFFFS